MVNSRPSSRRQQRDLVAIGGVITAIVAALGALIFNAVTAANANNQLELTRQGQLTDRYSKAVEQLGTPGPTGVDVRLGGIYALERLAHDSPADQPTIVEVLAAFVRDNARRGILPASKVAGPRPATDVTAALTVLGRRDTNRHDSDRKVDLSGVNFSGLDLAISDFADTNLAGADLADANLTLADLTGANLALADLTGANLRSAKLASVDLFLANMTRADLTDANLTGANLTRADLTRADLTRADLTRADLTGANLTNAEGLPSSPTPLPRVPSPRSS
jgi:hypothetical protein